MNQLYALLDIEDPQSVLHEVRTTVLMISNGFDFGPVDMVYEDIVRLFSGNYPGYRECNTGYHDLQHAIDAFLTTARLMHGACIRGHNLSNKSITLGLISALMHDTGYIQEINDNTGTGAKYTPFHVSRSIEFMRRYFIVKGYSQENFRICRSAILCTDHDLKTGKIVFTSKENELIGKVLGTGDLLGQMASRTYLEKLLFLFREYKEAYISGYKGEFDFLKKSFRFYKVVKRRIMDELGSVYKYMKDHFRNRWRIDKDLYLDAIKNHMTYLKSIIENHAEDHRRCLRRGGLVKKLTGLESSFTNNVWGESP